MWFLAPTVALAVQQEAAISQQLPAFQTRLLSGADNVDKWTTQQVWDAMLLNIRVVISTPQVLLDALSNGFVRLAKLALLVFDEGNHPKRFTRGVGLMSRFSASLHLGVCSC